MADGVRPGLDTFGGGREGSGTTGGWACHGVALPLIGSVAGFHPWEPWVETGRFYAFLPDFIGSRTESFWRGCWRPFAFFFLWLSPHLGKRTHRIPCCGEPESLRSATAETGRNSPKQPETAPSGCCPKEEACIPKGSLGAPFSADNR